MSDKIFTHQWKVLKVKPNELLVYQRKFREYTGDSTVTFAINERGEDVILTVTTNVIEDYPTNIPELEERVL